MHDFLSFLKKIDYSYQFSLKKESKTIKHYNLTLSYDMSLYYII